MDSIAYKEFKTRTEHSIMVHKMLQNGTFWKNKNLIDELFDDSALEEENCNYNSRIRIGPKYQALIPELLIKNDYDQAM